MTRPSLSRLPNTVVHERSARTGARLVAVVASIMILTSADAGHELPIYPSYYPQEIRIESLAPAPAMRLLQDARIHAYVGGGASFEGKVPETVSYVESLGSYLTVHFNPASPRFESEEARCAAARNVGRTLARAAEGFVFHPYPVTPYHPDYLQHADLAEAEKARYANEPVQAERPGAAPLRIRAKGPVAARIVPAKWRATGTEWDAALEEVDVGELVAARAVALNGWLGPPWLKEGWFHAFTVLAGTVSDGSARTAADRVAEQLRAGAHESPEERLNLERGLVRLLARGCARVVIGYTVKREYFNSEFSAGVENIAYDSETGLNSPLFIRTVKLKDFPWNGWLRLGVNATPSAAWNPIAGFTDPAGRLLWFALGDPAFLPEPYGRGWGPNRVESFKSARGSE